MNKRLQKKIEKSVVEQRGWHLALTSFALEAFGATEEDMQSAGSSKEELDNGTD